MQIEAKAVEVIEAPEVTTGEWWGIVAAGIGFIATCVKASES
jgi:hypothetical protein